MRKMVRKTISFVLAVAMIFLIAGYATSCLSSNDTAWQGRWTNMVTNGIKKVTAVHIHHSYGMVSSQIDIVKKLADDDISSFVKVFKDIDVNFTETNEAVDFFDSYYAITFINDITENKDDGGNVVCDDTGSTYKYAVRIYIDMDGYLFVKEEADSETQWHKSNVAINIEQIEDYYQEATRLCS